MDCNCDRLVRTPNLELASLVAAQERDLDWIEPDACESRALGAPVTLADVAAQLEEAEDWIDDAWAEKRWSEQA